MKQMINDSQLGLQEDIVVPGPFVNTCLSVEDENEANDFTPKSKERFYKVSDSELNFIASKATAVSTQEQTKWAVKILKGTVSIS